MTTYATATDVTNRWGEAVEDEALITLIETRLGDAERMIKRRIKDLDAQVDAGTIDADDVIQVEADAVLRLARNPEGFQSETDGSYTYMLQTNLSTGKLEILPDEWEILGITSNAMFLIVPNPVVGT